VSVARAARRPLVPIVMALLLADGTIAQEPKPVPPGTDQPTFRTGAEVVVLDVVVRDKKGRTVRDLRPEELQVYEDGVRQKIVSFKLEAAGQEPSTEAEAGKAAEPPAPGVASRTPDAGHFNLVTLVFDQLGAEARRIAREAGLDLLEQADRSDLVVSVFQVKESLRLIQQFTADRATLRAAVRAATGDLNTQYLNATESLEAAVKEADESRQRFESMAAVAGANQAGTAAQLGREADMSRMVVDALRMTESLQREQQGNSSLYGILSLARQQRRLAGRKTILFFSEGLQVPPALEHVLQATISEANRANVSVYAVDARGLREERVMEATRETLLQAARASQQQMMRRGGEAVSREEIFVADTAEKALRMDAQAALGDLAAGTGGVLVANTNDVRRGIQRAVGDLHGYYEVVYEPVKQEYDGRFRKIEVKVARPQVSVQARSGYFALPPGEGTATFPYELDLLRALRAVPAPADFETRTSVFRFGPEGSGVRHTAVLEVPLAGIAFEASERGDVDRAHFSMMTVLRDPSGAVIEKFSEDSPVFLPRPQREALKQGNAVFIRSFRVPPGRYTLETAVFDQVGRHQSVQRAAVNVATPVTRVHVSNVALVKRSEPVPPGALPSEDPFRLGKSRIVPWITEPHLQPGQALSLFLVAYPKGAAPRSDLLVELLRDGTLIAQTLLELPAPDEHGRIPYVATIPVDGLKPGRYQVRVLFNQGGATAQEHAYFTLDGA
jgi:VWFA-related protein